MTEITSFLSNRTTQLVSSLRLLISLFGVKKNHPPSSACSSCSQFPLTWSDGSSQDALVTYPHSYKRHIQGWDRAISLHLHFFTLCLFFRTHLHSLYNDCSRWLRGIIQRSGSCSRYRRLRYSVTPVLRAQMLPCESRSTEVKIMCWPTLL